MLRLVYVRRHELLIRKQMDSRTVRHPRDGLRIEAVTRAHAAALQRFNARHRSIHKVRASAVYLACGYRGFLAFRDDELVGYWWWVDNTIDPALTYPCVARFGLLLPDDAVFAFDYFIVPDARDEGVAVKFLTAIYAELVALGYRTVWGSVDADNVRARWVYSAVGNRVVAHVVGYEIASTVLYQDGRFFLRNSRWSAPHPFEHRLLWPRATRAVAPARTSPAASDVSTDGV